MHTTSFARLRLTTSLTTIALVSGLFLLADNTLGSGPPFGSPQQPDSGTRLRIAEAYARLPLVFEANRGQSDEQVRFLARGSGYTLFLTPGEMVLALGGSRPSGDGVTGTGPETVIRLTLRGAQPEPRLEGLENQAGTSNYLLGDSPRRWHTAIPTFGRVRYHEPYPGVDLDFYGNQGQMEYDFVVSPGTDPGVIALGVEGSQGQAIDANGDLELRTDGGEVRWQRPTIYQEIDGVRQMVTGGFALMGTNQVGFHVGRFDPTRPLVIDPVLVYSTFLGGSDLDEGQDITVDDQGHAYVAGFTTSADFPSVTPALAPRATANDAFVTKLSTDGSGLVFSTYLGGSDNDELYGIALDAAGNIYLGGATRSTNFPTVNPFAAALGGVADIFVAKLSPAGDEILYSTYLGGSVGFLDGSDSVIDLTLDATNKVYVTGITTADDFPVSAGAMQGTHGGSEDAYVAKFDLEATGAASLVYATYLGGSDLERGVSIAVDAAGNAYVAGRTDSLDFPATASAFQTGPQGGPPELANLDAFVAKLSADGSTLLYATYLGGTLGDLAYGIAVDRSGIGLAYVTGHTYSPDFPVSAAAFDKTLDGQNDVFVALIHTGLEGEASRLAATYFGGTSDDVGFGIAVDADANLAVTGATNSIDFPVTADAVQSAYGGGALDAYIVRLSPTLVEPPSYSSLLGGAGDDRGLEVAVDADGDIFVTGFAEGDGFPATADGFDTTAGGGHDVFVARFTKTNEAATPAPT